MNLVSLLEQLHGPMLITAEAHASIRQLLEARLGDAISSDPEAAKRQAELWGRKIDLPSMQVVDGIATIPIQGPIGNKLSDFAKFLGFVDSQDVAKDIAEAEADPKVRAVLFDIDSPGGMVNGTPELADLVAGMRKPTAAFSDGMMASALYWVGSSAGQIYGTRSAQFGSIGVYLPVFDVSAMFAQAGVKVELITGGRLKGIGFPGTSLSEAQRTFLQEQITKLYAEFKAQVLKTRGAGVKDETMQGQVFYAPEAMQRGLVDVIVRSKADALDFLRGN